MGDEEAAAPAEEINPKLESQENVQTEDTNINPEPNAEPEEQDQPTEDPTTENQEQVAPQTTEPVEPVKEPSLQKQTSAEIKPEEIQEEKEKSVISVEAKTKSVEVALDQPKAAVSESAAITTSKGSIPAVPSVPSKDEKLLEAEKEAKKGPTTEEISDGKKMPEASFESLEKKQKHEAMKQDSREMRKSRTERLTSKARNVLGSVVDIRRLSVSAEYYDKIKGARYMNTYKLDSDNPFNPDKVKKILESVMVEALENLTYDIEKCPKQAKWASGVIRAKVKELQFDRYKLICLVSIGEKNSQDVLVTCRFLWDVDRDRYASYCIENTYVFGIALCFGIYYE